MILGLLADLAARADTYSQDHRWRYSIACAGAGLLLLSAVTRDRPPRQPGSRATPD